MKKCINCDCSMPDEARFCPRCGHEQPSQAPMQQSNQTPNSEPMQQPYQTLNQVPVQQPDSVVNQEHTQQTNPASNQAPYQASMQQPVKKPGSKMPLVIIMIVLVCVLLGAVGFVVFGKMQRNRKNDDVNKSKIAIEESDSTLEPKHEETTADKGESTQKTTRETTQETTMDTAQETTEPSVNSVSFVRDYSFAFVQSSSALTPQDGNRYEGSLVEDGDLTTAWSEGVDGDGIGEFLILSTYDTKVRNVGQLVIYGGYHKSSDTYIKNGAPTSIQIILSDGYSENVYLDYDSSHIATVDLGGLHATNTIMITITGVRSGSAYDDTCISEIEVMTDGTDSVATPMTGNALTQHIASTSAYQADGDYVLPDSSQRILTDADLYGMTKEQLKIARNEIYARHGRLFNDKDLQSYFNSKPWYIGTVSPDRFNEDMLTDIEKYNRDLIKKHEGN